jgi:hypothetical protein
VCGIFRGIRRLELPPFLTLTNECFLRNFADAGAHRTRADDDEDDDEDDDDDDEDDDDDDDDDDDEDDDDVSCRSVILLATEPKKFRDLPSRKDLGSVVPRAVGAHSR